MNTFQLSSLPQNPFIRTPFWGRQNELRTIYSRLISNPPQCCAIIGETFSGKTTLLRHLADSETVTIVDDQKNEHKLFLIYLDCSRHIDLIADDHASVQFWWALYRETRARLQPDKKPEPIEPPIGDADSISSVHKAYEIKSMLDELVSDNQYPVIF